MVVRCSDERAEVLLQLKGPALEARASGYEWLRQWRAAEGSGCGEGGRLGHATSVGAWWVSVLSDEIERVGEVECNRIEFWCGEVDMWLRQRQTRIYARDEAPARSGREDRWKAGAPDGSDAEDQGIAGSTETCAR